MKKRGNPAKPERETAKEERSPKEEKESKGMAPWMKGKMKGKKGCK